MHRWVRVCERVEVQGLPDDVPLKITNVHVHFSCRDRGQATFGRKLSRALDWWPLGTN